MDLTGSHATTQFIFPILRHSDILQCMSELGIELTKAELVEPGRHRDRVKKVFLQLLDICCGLSEEDFDKVTPDMQEALTAISKFPKLHEDNFKDVKCFLELRKCMEICGFYDFGWKDLHTPTPKRFRCQLSAAINMAKFREDQLKLYAELNEPRAELLLALEEVNEENSQLNEQLSATQMDSNDKMREMEVVEQECEELEVEIGRNNKVQTAKREEATELKKKHNELKDELATAKLALQEVQADYESLQNKVVSSPERRKHDLRALKQLVNEERDEAKSLEDEWQKTKTDIVQVAQAIKDVPETTKLVQEVLEGTQKISQIQDEVQSARTEKETISKETNETQEEVEGSEASLHRSDEKLAHARKQYKLKMDAAQEALDSAKDQLLDVEMEHSQGTARVEAGEAEVKAMETRIEEERERAEAEIEDMIAQYKIMERSVLDQNAAFMGAIQAS